MLCNNAVAKVMLLMYISSSFFHILSALSRFLTFNKFFFLVSCPTMSIRIGKNIVDSL